MSAPATHGAQRAIVTARRNSPLALAVFVLAYVGILVIVVSPHGALVSPPPVAQADR